MYDHIIECAKCGKGHSPDYCGIIKEGVSSMYYAIRNACMDCGSKEIKILRKRYYAE